MWRRCLPRLVWTWLASKTCEWLSRSRLPHQCCEWRIKRRGIVWLQMTAPPWWLCMCRSSLPRSAGKARRGHTRSQTGSKCSFVSLPSWRPRTRSWSWSWSRSWTKGGPNACVKKRINQQSTLHEKNSCEWTNVRALLLLYCSSSRCTCARMYESSATWSSDHKITWTFRHAPEWTLNYVSISI